MRRVSAAVFLAAALVVGWLCVAPGPVRADDDDEARVILFSGRDLWRNGAFAHGGFLIAPGGFDQDGFLLKLLLSGGLYQYYSGDVRVVGAEAVLQALPGVRIKRGDVEMKFFFGLDFEGHRYWPDDPANTLRGRALGMRMATDIWWEPTPATVGILETSVSTIATNRYARAAYGWRVLDEQFYFGPEIAGYDSDGYRQLRLGGHFTSLKTDNYEWSAAGGWARDSAGRSSPYVRLGMMQRM